MNASIEIFAPTILQSHVELKAYETGQILEILVAHYQTGRIR